MDQASHDNQAAQILSNTGAMCGICGDEPGDRTCPDCEACRLRYVAALRAAGWAPRAELQQQIDQARAELASLKEGLAGLATTLTGGTV